MSLKSFHVKPVFWLILIFLIWLLAACAGATAEPSANNANAEATADLQEWLNSQGDDGLGVLNGEGEIAADVVTPAPTFTPAPIVAAATADTAVPNVGAEVASQTTDADGITVGFTADGHAFKGSPDAPIVMEEFSDFQCPYCARWADQTLPDLVADQIANGQVMLIYYDFPLSSIHPQAAAAANAARCAGEQGAEAYWQYHDALFARVQEWSVNDPSSAFSKLAGELGLNEADFAACVAENRYSSQVQADVQLGQSRGVGSTPSFFLNDQALIGAQPTEVFNQAITALLNGESIAAAQPQTQPQPQQIVIPTPAAIALGDDDIAFAIGDRDAPVQIVEFTDYQCPYCQQHSVETLPRILQEMVENGRVYYVFKDFPLDIHPEARVAAKAVRCGGEQEAYLEMHDAVFSSQGHWGGQGEAKAGDVFASLATEIGLDAEAFAACYQSNVQDDLVQANVEEAIALGVRSTPSFFFNGYLASGAMPFDSFEQIVTWAENGELAAQVEANIRAAYAAQLAQQQQQQVPPTPAGPVDVPTEDVAFAIGSPDAPVTIVEYTDYQCPFCSRHFAETYPQLIEQYVDTGLVRYVFKDFPLTSIHPQAVAAAEAARCAGEQNAYLEMHDALFANQNQWSGQADPNSFFISYAEQIGLEPTPFTECLESGRYQTAVEADLNEGIGFGIRGTPTFFINGHIFVGAQPIEAFAQMITAVQNQ